MRKMMRMLILFLICCLLLPAAALAEDVCVVKDASAVSRVTTACPYLRVQYALPQKTRVTLSVEDAWGGLIYQRDYGVCSGNFRSRDVHLPMDGDRCEYTVTLTTETEIHTFTVIREQPMITDSAVYAGGLSLKELNGGSSRKYALVLDLAMMDGQTAAAPMLASGLQIGEVYFTVEDGSLTVSAALLASGEIDKATVYVAADALTAQTLGASRFTGVKTKMNKEIPLGDASYAAVMVQFTVTYDPETAQPFAMTREAEEAYQQMVEVWQTMQMTTANEAVG